ncbi:MAG: 23S rRNA (cytidine(2498)-2'-O)-methyltransferase RlmM [endosymbiont of Galathealinum brachiosum]|uniref:23S rRNA (Cytidine(2498)-2'-O)-methyltransferase RlmM n=1 Tax=endosymbiont of Galathealinum brachiosum TaxID=2200906 RepID=A0A370DIE3_9GAMM|nr:MAG: 23S rRNA (cytidine(2498)-2'-O)-methyltransferase RlmM [endosymbiont of Galathealinum brachiosum]
MKPLCCLLYCRPGFEKESASEIMQLTQSHNIMGYIKAKPDSGYVGFYPTSPIDLIEFNKSIKFKEMIFSRQSLFVSEMINTLPPEDRITPLLTAIQTIDLTFNTVFLETPDTNEGKQLSGFCKKFTTPLTIALERKSLIQKKSEWRLHLFFLSSSAVYIGISHIRNSSTEVMGIKRLRFPKMAPSRSTLKLEEAFKTMLSEKQQQDYLKNGMTAVDLGACPGGWTWQLVNRGIRVNAIDNGAMDKALMDSGIVKEIKADGFKYLPETPVDWLVCDMVERPMHITRLMTRWLTDGHCKYAAFNLKLPMKKRYDMVMDCKNYISEELDRLNISYNINIKHLYHDREEVTCIVLLT